MREAYDLVIIGTGAAGLSAALYAGRYMMVAAAIGEEFGGETASAGTIWNYPGAKGVDGYELMKLMKEQAIHVGADIIDGKVEKIEKDGSCFVVHTNTGSIFANTIIFAIGTKRRHLGLPNEKELTGKGVHYCITCDGPLYTGREIAIVGGGDASVKGANLAAEYAKKIHLITLEKELRAEPVNLEEMKKLGDKVNVIYETAIQSIMGSEKLEKIILSRKDGGGDSELLVDGLFVEIGALPNAELATSIGVTLDQKGYIATDSSMATNVPGVFAAGDTTNFFGSFKQDITAAAMGAMAATSAYRYKKEHGNVCEKHFRPVAVSHM